MMTFVFGLGLIVAGAAMSGEAIQTNTPTASVSGRIVEEGTNAPIAGGHVMLLPESPPSIAGSPVPFSIAPPMQITDEDGHYGFDGIPPGRYRIDAQKAGFASAIDPLDMDPSTFRWFELTGGQSLDDMNVSLKRGAVIAGQIFDPSSGAPMVDARVMAMRRLPNGPAPLLPIGQDARTNDLGEFRIFGLPSGEYLIAAAPRSDFVFEPRSTSSRSASASTAAVMTFYPGTADRSAAQLLTVAAGQEMNGITIRLVTEPVFQVSGVVIDESGAPVAGAMVILMGDPMRGGIFFGPGGQAQSDTDGRFVIDSVASGSYTTIATLPIMFNDQAVTTGGIGGFSFAGGSAQMPGAGQVEVTVSGTSVDDLKIVVTRPQ
jgi:carboxypeptidase family protein